MLAEAYFKDIKTKLCKDPLNCSKLADLNPPGDFKFEVKMSDHQKTDGQYIAKFERESIYRIENGEIIWKISPLNPK